MFLKIVSLLLAVLLPLVFAQWATTDNASNLNSLNDLKFITDFFILQAQPLFNKPPYYITLGMKILVGISSLALLASLIKGRKNSLFFVLIISIVAFQWQLLWGSLETGFIIIPIFIIIALLDTIIQRKYLSTENIKITDSYFNWIDLIMLFSILLICCYLRFYSINTIPNYFEGELAPYMIGSTDFKGIFVANAGTLGPWAPLGILYYLPMYFANKVFGISLTSVRISSGLVSCWTVALIYGFLFVINGRKAAILGSLFLVFDSLQIGWGRTDVHPHGVTAWPSIIISLLTFKAISTDQWKYYLLIVPCMALTWHQYPSGQMAFLIPMLAFLINLLVTRFKVRFWFLKGILLLVGAVLWAFGGLFAYRVAGVNFTFQQYFRSLGPRLSNGPLSASKEDFLYNFFNKLFIHTQEVISGIYYRIVSTFHQDILAPAFGVPTRFVCWIVATLATVALLQLIFQPKKKISIVLITALVVASLSSILSDYTYAKRSATLYAYLCAMAGIGGSIFLDRIKAIFGGRFLHFTASLLIISGFSVWLAVSSSQWFGGKIWQQGIPPQNYLDATIGKIIKPESLIIGIPNDNDNYEHGKMVFSLMNILLNDPKTFIHTAQPVNNNFQWDMIDSIIKGNRAIVKAQYYYLWSALRDKFAYADDKKPFNEIVFILQHGKGFDRNLSTIMRKYPTKSRIDTADNGYIYGYTILYEKGQFDIVNSEMVGQTY